MDLAFDPASPPPHLRTLLCDLGLAPGTLDLAVDRRDEMLAFLLESESGDLDRALFTYFRSGASLADALGQVLRWRFGSALERLGRLLDFASGYGRVTRFLVRDLPPERIWVSDIYSAGVRFQEERFGVHGIVSTVDPDDFARGEPFDAILVTSLFTHLPEATFRAWLRVLLGLLAPGGLLAFSAHGPEVLLSGVELPASGILFQELSESGSLATRDYGSTWVEEGFVRRAVQEAAAAANLSGGAVSTLRLPRGMCNFQDLYLVVLDQREEDRPFDSLAFQAEPQLFVERALLPRPGELELAGWAAARQGEVRAIEAWLDDRRVGASAIEGERPDVAAFFAGLSAADGGGSAGRESAGDARFRRSGWHLACALPPGTSLSTSILRLRLLDGRGVWHVLLSSSLEGLLLTSSRHEASTLAAELRHREALWTLERQRAEARLQELAARIGAMEASRFWKLRNAWWRLKGALGIAKSGS
jgi:SAM-dependent methyltransferase